MGSSISPAASSLRIGIPAILVLLILIATLFVIVSAILRKKKAAKVFQVLVAVISCISIFLSGVWAVVLLSAGNAANRDDGDGNVKDNGIRRLALKYVEELEEKGYSDIRVKLVDISDAMGKEALSYFYDGVNHVVQIWAVMGDEVKPIYTKTGTQGSVYLADLDGVQYILEYFQELDNNYTQNYSYSLFRFDDLFDESIRDKNSLSVAADAQGGGAAGTSFFNALTEYLTKSSVCYDPYALMGDTIMQVGGGATTDEDNVQSEAKYLSITNCSTNKIGIVTMKKDTSWLNFRSGPARSYAPVLIDPYDSESYVKQTQHSIVTVLEPENTYDTEYPVWYKIRITYNNRVLEGYSSQNYIRVEGIRTVRVGQQFKIEAETNDSGIYWRSSDSTVAYIDPATGLLTTHRAGVVLITVTTDSGLTDSCLIMVE